MKTRIRYIILVLTLFGFAFPALAEQRVVRRVEADALGRRAETVYIVNSTQNSARCEYEVTGYLWRTGILRESQEQYFDRGVIYLRPNGEAKVFQSGRAVDNSIRVSFRCDRN